jgi:hypothetical protein
MNDGHDGDDDGPAVQAHTAQASSTHRHKDKHKYIKYSHCQPHGHGRRFFASCPNHAIECNLGVTMAGTVHRRTHNVPARLGWLAGWLAG